MDSKWYTIYDYGIEFEFCIWIREGLLYHSTHIRALGAREQNITTKIGLHYDWFKVFDIF